MTMTGRPLLAVSSQARRLRHGPEQNWIMFNFKRLR